jgi:archaellum component FlaC
MTESLSDIEALIEGLKQQRDAIKVQLHLGKAEAKQEWEEMENKLERLRAKVKAVGDESQQASQDVFEAAKLLAEEIKRGYDRIRKQL